MPYTDFTLEQVLSRFPLQLRKQAVLAPQDDMVPIVLPTWLLPALARGTDLALNSEKSRSEFIVAPVLLAVRELLRNQVAIYSGQRLDVEPANGLSGECDFLLSATPTLPVVQTPLIGIVEAKKNDIEAGLGQCAAQMLGALRFNQRENPHFSTVYGCVTTGEAWQFLQLSGDTLTVDTQRYYIVETERILGVFVALLTPLLSP